MQPTSTNEDLERYLEDQVAKLVEWRDELVSVGFGAQSFMTKLEGALRDGLRALYHLDASHPFWIARVREPSPENLRDYTAELLATSYSPAIAWQNLAAWFASGANGGGIGSHPIWQDPEMAKADIGWFLAASFKDWQMGSDRTPITCLAALRDRIPEYVAHVVASSANGNPEVRSWVREELPFIGAG